MVMDSRKKIKSFVVIILVSIVCGFVLTIVTALISESDFWSRFSFFDYLPLILNLGVPLFATWCCTEDIFTPEKGMWHANKTTNFILCFIYIRIGLLIGAALTVIFIFLPELEKIKDAIYDIISK